MTDYEAVFEDVMRYMPGSPDGITTKAQLKRFLRQNDKRNTMSDQLLNKLADTRASEELIERQTTIREFKQRGNKNLQREKTQKRQLRAKGKKITGTYTQKTTGKRVVLYLNTEGKQVYKDEKGFTRDTKGRFAKE